MGHLRPCHSPTVGVGRPQAAPKRLPLDAIDIYGAAFIAVGQADAVGDSGSTIVVTSPVWTS
jgi:hypothetical protein